jgi:hypothetical protein
MMRVRWILGCCVGAMVPGSCGVTAAASEPAAFVLAYAKTEELEPVIEQLVMRGGSEYSGRGVEWDVAFDCYAQTVWIWGCPQMVNHIIHVLGRVDVPATPMDMIRDR